MRARGSLEPARPVHQAGASAALLAGADIDQAGRFGTTNGAAMRITPVGIASPGDGPGRCWSTGWSRPAGSPITPAWRWPARPRWRPRSARAIDGATVPEATRRGGRRGGARPRARALGGGRRRGRPDQLGRGLTAGLAPPAAIDAVYTLVGTSLASQESVPAAFAVLAAGPGRSLAGLPDGRVRWAGTTDTHRRDGRGGRRGVPRGGARSPRRARARSPGERPAAGRGRRRPARAQVGPVAPAGRRRSGRPAGVGGPFGGCCTWATWSWTWCWTSPALPDRGGDVLAPAAEADPRRRVQRDGRGRPARGCRSATRARYGTGPLATWPGRAAAAEGIEVLQPPKPGLDTGFVVAMVERQRRADVPDQPGCRGHADRGRPGHGAAAPADAIYLSGYGLVHPGQPGRADRLAGRAGRRRTW